MTQVQKEERDLGPYERKIADGELDKQQQILTALNHPLRVQLLTILNERIASPAQMFTTLADRAECAGDTGFSTSLSDVSYHTKVLKELGQIELVETSPNRGFLEHFYRAVARAYFTDEEWEALDTPVRDAISRYGLDAAAHDVRVSIEAGLFDARGDRHLSRVPMRLDQRAWLKIAKIMVRTLNEITTEQEAAARRLGPDEGFAAIAFMATFEVPADRIEPPTGPVPPLPQED